MTRFGRRLDHGHGHALALLGEELGHSDLLAEDRGHRQLDLEADLHVDAGGQVLDPLQLVDRLRGRVVDVDQALVGADLEVLARVLVLERRADHAVDVLGSRQGNGARDGRAGALRRLDDLAWRPGRWRRGRTP